MSTAKPSCERTEQVAGFALRALPAAETPAFAAHLEWCSECRAELASLRPIIDSFTDWPTDVLAPSRALWERLALRVDAEPTGEPLWSDEPDWNDVAPGIAVKVLATDEATGSVSMLVRLAAGVAYPAHTHAAVEELHLLDGELWIDERKLQAGDYYRAEPGSSDTHVVSDGGCTCVLVTSVRDVLR